MVRPGASSGTAQAIVAAHGASRQHQQLVHVGRRGDDGLGARDHHAARTTLHHVHVGIGVGLLMGAQAAIALGISHRDGHGEVARLRVVHILEKARVVVGAVLGIDAMGRLEHCVEAVHGEVAHGAAGLLAHHPGELQLVHQVAG